MGMGMGMGIKPSPIDELLTRVTSVLTFSQSGGDSLNPIKVKFFEAMVPLSNHLGQNTVLTWARTTVLWPV